MIKINKTEGQDWRGGRREIQIGGMSGGRGRKSVTKERGRKRSKR